MRDAFTRYSLLGALLAVPAIASAQVVGKYSDGNLTVDMSPTGDGQSAGTMTLGGKQYPARSQSHGGGFDGSFTAGGNSFPFNAQLNDDVLKLTTGGTTYLLKQLSAPVNPLAAQPANPLANNNPLGQSGTSAGGDLPGYTTEVSTDGGKSLVALKTGVSSVQAALEATFPDLAKYFGSHPQIGRAYEDAGNHQSGGATFSVAQNGQPMKGFVSCKMTSGSTATVAVIFARADISRAEWTKLITPKDTPAPAAADEKASDLAKLLTNGQVVNFADGTGSITVAEGWNISQSQSALDPIIIKGPANQFVAIGNSCMVQSPDSQLMKLVRQNEASARRLGIRPPPPPPFPVAEFSDPVQALQDVGPQMSKINAARGGPSTHIDNIISHQDVAAFGPTAKAAIVNWDVTQTLNGTVSQLRVLATIQIAPMPGGSWMYLLTGFQAPKESFSNDQPLMAAMIASEKFNPDAAMRVIQERSAAQRRMLNQMADTENENLQRNHDQFMHDQAQRNADYQQRHAEQMAGYQRHNDQWAADELQKSRNNADFVETIRGTRTVYDTSTGQSATVDLNYSTAVVNQLNDAALDPNRFVQIPLRDEMYPK
jgi:hypothetical protein